MAFDSYTKALLHFEGTDASTTFTDELGKTWTANGSAQIDTAAYKFGNSCGLSAAGTSNYISTSDHADFQFGSGDFTIDCWFKISANGSGSIAWRGLSTQFGFHIFYDSPNINLTFMCFDGVIDRTITHPTNITTATWHHAALVVSAHYCTLYLDGVGNTSEYLATVYNFSGSFKTLVGGSGADLQLDELRVSKGVARWTSNFNPPTAPYSSENFIPQIMVSGE